MKLNFLMPATQHIHNVQHFTHFSCRNNKGTGEKYEENEDVREQHHKALLYNHLSPFLPYLCVISMALLLTSLLYKRF